MIEVTGRRGKRGKQLLNDLNEERNFIHTLNRRKGNWIGHILCGNCLLKQGIEGKVEGLIEVTGRRERRLKQLLDDLKEERDIVHTVNRMSVNWIGHILCGNCLLKQVIEGKVERMIEVMVRRGRRHKQLLYDLEEETGYWK